MLQIRLEAVYINLKRSEHRCCSNKEACLTKVFRADKPAEKTRQRTLLWHRVKAAEPHQSHLILRWCCSVLHG
ncbi:hypothetical protein MTO96_027382, partial [Rhipicephalus appendiculatus]